VQTNDACPQAPASSFTSDGLPVPTLTSPAGLFVFAMPERKMIAVPLDLHASVLAHRAHARQPVHEVLRAWRSAWERQHGAGADLVWRAGIEGVESVTPAS
jgi:hypothetical protein